MSSVGDIFARTFRALRARWKPLAGIMAVEIVGRYTLLLAGALGIVLILVGGLDLSVDCYDFWADTLNNLGGQPALATYASSHLGQEITPTLQWMVNANLFVQGLASYLVPGPGLRDTLPGPTHVWQTYKLSLYWFY